jgi:hypothetical protein
MKFLTFVVLVPMLGMSVVGSSLIPFASELSSRSSGAIAHDDPSHDLPTQEGHPAMPMNPSEDPQEEGSHTHEQREVPAGEAVPSVRLVIHPDAHQGWNLEIETTNFQFAPEHINQSSQIHEGHAHLYLDGVKLTRLYGNWFYLNPLEPGTHEITVTLNTNTHETLAVNGEPIQATVLLTVSAPGE